VWEADATMGSPDLLKVPVKYLVAVEPPLCPSLVKGWCVSSQVMNQLISSSWMREISDSTPSVVVQEKIVRDFLKNENMILNMITHE